MNDQYFMINKYSYNYVHEDDDSDIDEICLYRGICIFNECWKDMNLIYGGASNVGSDAIKKSIASKITSKLFSQQTKITMTRIIRGLLRTGSGVAADIFTVGAGGDVVVNSLFAVHSSSSFISNIGDIISAVRQAHGLFDELIFINKKMKIPIVCRLDLDDGFQSFEKKFDKILYDHVAKYGSKFLSKVYDSIIKILEKITSTVSDWIACLFPDTVGIAGEVSKTILDYVTNHGYDYIYNLIGIMPDNMQKMVTNTFALKKLIHDAIIFLRKIIKSMSPAQFSKIIEAVGTKVGNHADNVLVKSAVNVGTSVAKNVSRYTLGIATMYTSMVPQANDIIVYVIDKYIIPNIDSGVELFMQLFPIYLMFTLFLQRYPDIKKSQNKI